MLRSLLLFAARFLLIFPFRTMDWGEYSTTTGFGEQPLTYFPAITGFLPGPLCGMLANMKIGFVHLGRENLGIQYLSSVAKEYGHQVALYYDPGLFGSNDNVFYIPSLESKFGKSGYLLERISIDKPDVICFSVYTTTFRWALDLAGKLKEQSGIPILFGGLHVTLAPDEVMSHPQVDMAVAGEAEAVFIDAVNAVTGKGKPEDVKNLIWRKNGEVVENPLAPPIENLDSIPLPDKALFEKDVNFVDDYMIMTNRGCPYSCAYCCESALNDIYGNKFFRRRSVESVMDELVVMFGRYRFREVMFNDSIFFTHKEWLFTLLEQYRKKIGRPFRCFGQVTYLDEEIASELVRAGCYAIEFGVQTLNETVRKNILKRKESNEENSKAFSICDKYKIHYDVDHIFGLPGETDEDYFFAARYYSDLKYLNRIKCHYLTYFPGTKIVQTALEMGLLTDGDVADIHKGQVGDFFHDTEKSSGALEKKARDFQKFFKVLPLLPKSWTENILQKDWMGFFRKLPAPFMIFLQVLGAIKGRDYRFFLYIKYYFFRIKRNWHIVKYNKKAGLNR